ncbi:hypothetical protein ACFV4F_32365 [Kitasatospora sp. NPDC059722]|uniref:hypothetical protein n=1 Tax=Kitasatospora sp. NPDC059722 TaxID=3346925 RepID=UPI0036A7CB5D
MKRLKAALGIGAATLAASASMLAGAGTAHADTVLDCADGYVCIYSEGIDSTTVTNRYYNYGTYNLSNQYNNHWVFNHQTGGAHVALCYGYNGTNCLPATGPGWQFVNLTPINSIVVSP